MTAMVPIRTFSREIYISLDDSKLGISQANHVPDDNPERPLSGNTGRERF
jgi:hypothetical protein